MGHCAFYKLDVLWGHLYLGMLSLWEGRLSEGETGGNTLVTEALSQWEKEQWMKEEESEHSPRAASPHHTLLPPHKGLYLS